MPEAPAPTNRVEMALRNTISTLTSSIRPTDEAGMSVLKEAQDALSELVALPKSQGITKKAADEAWAEFVREEGNLEMFRFSTSLSALSDEQKKAILLKMRKAFDTALNSDILWGYAERDVIRRFEAMGMPENVAMYLWREKHHVRLSDRLDGEIHDARKHREAMAIEIMKWAMSPNRDEILSAMAKFFSFKPESIPDEVRKEMKKEEPSEFCRCGRKAGNHADKKHKFQPKPPECPPFMSESFLYAVFGKEDARTVLAYMRGLLRVLGCDEMEVWKRTKKLEGTEG